MEYINTWPEEIKKIIRGNEIKDMSCNSNAKTVYVSSGIYIKTDEAGSLEHEYEITKVFNKLNLAVEVIDYITSGNMDFLITKEGLGKDATNFLDKPDRLCEELAKSLLKLHEIKIEARTSPRHLRYLENIKNRNLKEFTLKYLLEGSAIKDEASVIKIIDMHRSLLKEDTLIHGDACLPNYLLKNYKFTTFIDLNLGGIGDRHTDLFWALWSLQYNLKTSRYNDYFLDAYGRDNFSMESLRLIEVLETF